VAEGESAWVHAAASLRIGRDCRGGVVEAGAIAEQAEEERVGAW
jgi:hypothetical protein